VYIDAIIAPSVLTSADVDPFKEICPVADPKKDAASLIYKIVGLFC
jgi:hypothetical protein